MAEKSIIDIEINDSNFNVFHKKLDQYKATLAAMPGQWGAIGKAFNNAGKGATFGQNITAVVSAMKDAKTNTERMTLAFKAADRTVSSLARGTRTIAVNLKDATTSLLKWGGVLTGFAGLLAGGGLFGISRMAQGMAAKQSAAWSNGVHVGQFQAAQTTYDQALGGGTGDMIGNIDTAMHTIGGEQRLRATLGGGYKFAGKNAKDVMQDYLDAMRKKMALMPSGGELSTPFLTDSSLNVAGMSISQAKAISRKNATGGYAVDLGGLRAENAGREKELAMSASTVASWANAKKQFDTIADKIENTFIRALTPLLKPLTDFGNSFAHAVNLLLGSPQVAGWIGKAGKGLESVAAYGAGKDFQKDMNGFLEGVDKAAGALWDFASMVGKITGFVMGGNLTGSQHRDLDALKKLNPYVAQLVEASERNPESANDKKIALDALRRMSRGAPNLGMGGASTGQYSAGSIGKSGTPGNELVRKFIFEFQDTAGNSIPAQVRAMAQ